MIIANIPETQLEAIAAKAQAALPLAVNGRIEKACRLVRSASVEVHVPRLRVSGAGRLVCPSHRRGDGHPVSQVGHADVR
jgi:hypothetical protein